MIDYFINVAVASSTYWIIALVVYLAYRFHFKNTDFGGIDHMPKIALSIFLVGTLIGMTSPSNTYKLTTDYNKQQDIARIKQLNDQAASQPLVMQDISRQPATVDERATGAVDMRTRVVQEVKED